MIVLLSPNLGFLGGVEKHVHDVATGLRARGHRVALVYRQAAGAERQRYAEAFDETSPLNESQPLLRQADLVYVHKAHEPEVLERIPDEVPMLIAVHDHDATCVRSHRYTPMDSAPCYRRPGLTCYRHGCVLVRRREGRLPVTVREPFGLLEHTRAMARRAVIVAGSAFLRHSLLDVGVPPDRVVVVHPVGPEATAPLQELPTEHVVAFVGQVIKGKGLDLLVRAMARLPSVRLVVAGQGNQRPQVDQLIARLGIGDRVQFLGALQPNEVFRVYDQARVVAVPSRWPEPFGMVGVEAMRRGRPVVGAWHGGIPEWLAHGYTGLGFRPADVDDLTETLRQALTSPTCETMAENARRRSKVELRYEQMLDGLEELIRRFSRK